MDVHAERWTDRTQRVMELALREALQLGFNYVAPEHVLLAILREGENVGAKAMEGMPVKKRVLDLLRGYEARESRSSAGETRVCQHEHKPDPHCPTCRSAARIMEDALHEHDSTPGTERATKVCRCLYPLRATESHSGIPICLRCTYDLPTETPTKRSTDGPSVDATEPPDPELERRYRQSVVEGATGKTLDEYKAAHPDVETPSCPIMWTPVHPGGRAYHRHCCDLPDDGHKTHICKCGGSCDFEWTSTPSAGDTEAVSKVVKIATYLTDGIGNICQHPVTHDSGEHHERCGGCIPCIASQLREAVAVVVSQSREGASDG